MGRLPPKRSWGQAPTVTWNHDAARGSLTVQCVESPWFVPCALIDEPIRSEVEECIAATGG